MHYTPKEIWREKKLFFIDLFIGGVTTESKKIRNYITVTGIGSSNLRRD